VNKEKWQNDSLVGDDRICAEADHRTYRVRASCNTWSLNLNVEGVQSDRCPRLVRRTVCTADADAPLCHDHHTVHRLVTTDVVCGGRGVEDLRLDHSLHQRGEHADVAPLSKAVLDRLPGPELFGHLSPSAASAEPPDNALELFAQALRERAVPSYRQERLY
jgi:hypothetical protein